MCQSCKQNTAGNQQVHHRSTSQINAVITMGIYILHHNNHVLQRSVARRLYKNWAIMVAKNLEDISQLFVKV